MIKGEWRPPNAGVRSVLEILEMIGLTGYLADTLVNHLGRQGLLVLDDYYVPSHDELFSLYYRIQGASYVELRFRWVMCREIFDALKKSYETTRYAMLADPILEFNDSDRKPWDILVPESYYVVEDKTLFNIPIRIDPAARTVMIELVEE